MPPSADGRVCVVGLGYVGLTLSVVLAEAGYRVLGCEIDAAHLAKIRAGRSFFHEPGLNERLERVVALGRLTASGELPEPGQASIYIITVGTPLGDDGAVRLDMVVAAARQVADVLSDGDGVCLRSTLRLGTTRNVIMPLLEASGRRFDLAFCPERTLEGRALDELSRLPQIVGAVTPEGADRFARFFNRVTPTVIQVRDPETAEMIKLVDNTSRDVGFAFANEIARLCGQAGIAAADVIRLGKLGYERTNLPMPGPVGGPCLSKDPYILMESFAALGVVPEIVRASRRRNEEMIGEAARFLRAGRPPGPDPLRIAILGLAFKGVPETDDTRGSTVRPLVESLRLAFPATTLVAFDPVVPPEEAVRLGVTPCPTVEAAFDGAECVVIHNNHPAFASLRLDRLSARMVPGGVIYDFWNLHEPSRLSLAGGVRYTAYGRHPVA